MVVAGVVMIVIAMLVIVSMRSRWGRTAGDRFGG
jgi:hypothetical protein